MWGYTKTMNALRKGFLLECLIWILFGLPLHKIKHINFLLNTFILYIENTLNNNYNYSNTNSFQIHHNNQLQNPKNNDNFINNNERLNSLGVRASGSLLTSSFSKE